MLHPVAQLGQHRIRNIQRVLGDKKHPNALGSNQPHHQLDALDQHLGRVLEQEVGFVKKEHQLGRVEVAHLGQGFKQLAEQPQQKSSVQARRVHQFVGGQNVDQAPATCIGLHEVGNVEHGLAKKTLAALGFNLHQTALNGANARRADVAVFGGETAGVVAHMLAHRPQVFHVKQQQAVVVGNLEHQLQHAGLGVVEVQHACQQQRPEIAHGGAYRVAQHAKNIPQGGRAG